MDGVVVRIVDLSPGGVGLLSPHAVTPGRVVDVRAELPTMGDGARPTRLQMTVTSCATHRDADASGAAARVWRIGGTVSTRNDADHDSLVEFSHVLALCSRRSVSAPQPSVTAPVAAESDLREAVGVGG
jgi:hypothetical protein